MKAKREELRLRGRAKSRIDCMVIYHLPYSDRMDEIIKQARRIGRKQKKVEERAESPSVPFSFGRRVF